MKPVRLAVIGGGHLGYIHTRIARQNSGFQLVAVCDPQPLAQQRIIDEFDIRVVSNWQKCIGEFDAAIVATPTSSHHEIACELIRHNVHLLIEKPLAATSAEAVEIAALAEEHGVTVQVGHVESFSPVMSALEEKDRQIRFIRSARHSGYTFRSTDVSVIQDLMIHDIDLVAELIGTPVRTVEASGTTVFGPHIDIAEARIVFECGAVAILSASRCSNRPLRSMEIFDDRGWTCVDFAAKTLERTVVGPQIARHRMGVESIDPGQYATIRDKLFTDYLPVQSSTAPDANAIELEQKDWLAAIQTRQDNRVSARRGARAVELAEQINRLASVSAWNQSGLPPQLLPIHSIRESKSAQPVRSGQEVSRGRRRAA